MKITSPSPVRFGSAQFFVQPRYWEDPQTGQWEKPHPTHPVELVYRLYEGPGPQDESIMIEMNVQSFGRFGITPAEEKVKQLTNVFKEQKEHAPLAQSAAAFRNAILEVVKLMAHKPSLTGRFFGSTTVNTPEGKERLQKWKPFLLKRLEENPEH